jgi:hypothetical protein
MAWASAPTGAVSGVSGDEKAADLSAVQLDQTRGGQMMLAFSGGDHRQ